MSQDHYAVLGVRQDADDAQIRKAFRSLSRHHHPDVGGDVDVYESISVAFSVLSDESRRRTYDASLGLPPSAGASARASGPGTPSSASARAAAGSARTGRTARSAASGPSLRERPVRIVGDDADRHLAAAPVRGEVPRRGLFDRSREQRTAILRDLTRAVSSDVPAVRLVLGLQLPRSGKVDGAFVAGTRVVLLNALPTPDLAHAWDGSTLRVGGKVVTVPSMGAPATELERAVWGSRAEGHLLLFTSPPDPFHPVIDHVGPRGSSSAPLNLSKARSEVTTFLAGGGEADAVNLRVLKGLLELSPSSR